MRGERTVVARVLSWRPLVAAGTVSYGIYLWHMFVILCLRGTPLWWSVETNLALVLVGATLVACASWFVVERPAMRLKDTPFFSSRVRERAPLQPLSTVANASTSDSSL